MPIYKKKTVGKEEKERNIVGKKKVCGIKGSEFCYKINWYIYY